MDKRMKKARRAHESGDLAGACLLYRKVAKDAPWDLDAWYLLGTAEAERGRLQAAEEAFTKAETLDPGSAMVQNNFGNVRFSAGDPLGARDRYRRAVQLDPRLAQAHFNLGRVLQGLKDLEGATVHLQAAADLDPSFLAARHLLAAVLLEQGLADRALPHLEASARSAGFALAPEARHLLDAVQGRNPAHPPEVYVRALFDRYAEGFDAHLVGDLGYAAPEQAASLLREIHPEPATLGRVLDLGCGTGLSGAALRDRAESLCGVDLSPAMLQQARTKGVYDRLVEADAGAFLAAAEPASFDLVLALDVLVYIGDPAELLQQTARVLAPGGGVALTIELPAGASDLGYRLMPSGRYVHDPAPLLARASEAGLREHAARTFDLRRGEGAWIRGWLAFLEKPPE